MDGVKSQAGHIRGTVAQLEEERDQATGAKNAAEKELEVSLTDFSLGHLVRRNNIADVPGIGHSI